MRYIGLQKFVVLGGYEFLYVFAEELEVEKRIEAK